VKALGCRNTTFVVPKDTNTLCRLVELIVRPNTVVVDLGCGDGIPTTHAAACGARRVLGVEINPLAVANTRTNTARVMLPAGTLDVVQIDMLEFSATRYSRGSASWTTRWISSSVIRRTFRFVPIWRPVRGATTCQLARPPEVATAHVRRCANGEDAPEPAGVSVLKL